MKTMLRKVAAAMGMMALAFFVAGPVDAAQGFYIGTGLGGTFPVQGGDILDDLDPTGSIALEYLHLGYNFTDQLGLGIQYGAAGGSVKDDLFNDDSVWSQGYMDLSFRYTFDQGQEFQPYLEFGTGTYMYAIMADDDELWSDPVTGFRTAVGGMYYFDRFYLAPEISYHFTKYSEAEVDPEYGSKYDVDFEATGDMWLFLVKVGFHWLKD